MRRTLASSTSVKGGVVVTLTGQLSRFSLQILSIAILSRILTAADFGYLAMVLAIVGIANVLGDFGLSLAAIQRKELDHEESSSLFWVNSLMGLVVALAMFTLGPLISRFYGTDVTAVTTALSVIFLLNGIAVQFRVLLTRAQKFASISLAEVAAQAVGLVSAVGIAILGAGVAALVTQQIAVSAVTLFALAASSGWRPSKPRWPRGVLSFIPFGASTTFTQVMNYLSVSVQPAALGRFADASAVGSYSRAYQIMTLPLQQISAPVTRVMLPNLTRARGTLRYDGLLLQAHTVFSYAVVFILLLLGVNSELVVSLVLGDQWHQIDIIISLLAVASMFQVVGYSYYWLCLSEARMTTLLFAELPGRVVLIVATIAAAQMGMIAVAAVVAGCSAFIWACSSLFLARRVEVSIRPLMLVNVRIFVGVALVVACQACLALFAPSSSATVRGVYCVVSLLFIVLLAALLPAYRADARCVASMFSKFGKPGKLSLDGAKGG